jgi:diguanylate cyclase (GGDEF)-like protein
MIVLTGTDYEGSMRFAERLRKTIEDYVFDNGVYSIQLTSSIGLAVFKPGEGIELGSKDLVQWADKALYESKKHGRNRVNGFNLNEIISKTDEAA